MKDQFCISAKIRYKQIRGIKYNVFNVEYLKSATIFHNSPNYEIEKYQKRFMSQLQRNQHQ